MRRPDSKKRIAPFGSSERFLRAHLGHQGDDCVLWPYRTDPNGYGLAVIDGKQRRANNWMCRLVYGEPRGIWKHAAHRCGNPSCVNPKHLRWATHRENMLDKRLHGTNNIGERNGKTPLTEADVLEIRNAPPDLKPLMEKFGLTRGGIGKIRQGVRWGHVGGPRSSKERNSWPTCRNGHPYDLQNTHWTSDGYRQCRACGAANARRRRAERTSASPITSPDHPPGE